MLVYSLVSLWGIVVNLFSFETTLIHMLIPEIRNQAIHPIVMYIASSRVYILFFCWRCCWCVKLWNHHLSCDHLMWQFIRRWRNWHVLLDVVMNPKTIVLIRWQKPRLTYPSRFGSTIGEEFEQCQFGWWNYHKYRKSKSVESVALSIGRRRRRKRRFSKVGRRQVSTWQSGYVSRILPTLRTIEREMKNKARRHTLILRRDNTDFRIILHSNWVSYSMTSAINKR